MNDPGDMFVGAVTGGRDHWPTLAEMEMLAINVQRFGVTDLRDGDCPTGLDRIARGYVKARGIAEVEKHPADWKTHGRAGGHIRNGTMLDGTTPGAKGRTLGIRVGLLFAFEGGVGTADCQRQAGDRTIEVVKIEPVAEPRPWNMYHKWSKEQERPPNLMYVGRSRKWGGPSPLANPFKLDPKQPREAQLHLLVKYRRWLWDRIQAGDRAVLRALESITPSTYLGCTCWPAPCHVEIIIRYLRWLWANG